jgi:hypothetical protein
MQAAAMKSTQIVLLLVLVVAIIFGVTFASMYVSQAPSKSPHKKKQDETTANLDLHLTFPVRVYPPNSRDPGVLIPTEYGQTGQHDFWFENPNDGEVRIGLLKKNCDCSTVQVGIVPNYQAPLSSTYVYQVIEKANNAAGKGHPNEHAQEFARLATAASTLKKLTGEAGDAAIVPPRAVGFVRLHWEARRSPTDPRIKLAAELWWQDPRKGGGVRLEANAFLVDGLRLDAPDVNTGTLNPGDSAQRTVRFWSSTRYQFEEPEIVSPSSTPFITWGKPVPLTDKDKAELYRYGGEVRSGYSLTVTVREQLPNGSRFDEGFFQHSIQIKPRERIILPEPLEVNVHGAVRGDISLIGVDNGIVLEPFNVAAGTRHQIKLQSERKDLSLKLDRFPDSFMKVTLGEPTMETSGQRTWLLTLEILPNRVSGAFPRRDSVSYRDTAIYLRIEGAADRRLRIPVSGKAIQ